MCENKCRHHYYQYRFALTISLYIFALVTDVLNKLINLKGHLVGGVEKWEDRKCGGDRKVRGWKILVFSYSCLVGGWKSGEMKTYLFG